MDPVRPILPWGKFYWPQSDGRWSGHPIWLKRLEIVSKMFPDQWLRPVVLNSAASFKDFGDLWFSVNQLTSPMYQSGAVGTVASILEIPVNIILLHVVESKLKTQFFILWLWSVLMKRQRMSEVQPSPLPVFFLSSRMIMDGDKRWWSRETTTEMTLDDDGYENPGRKRKNRMIKSHGRTVAEQFFFIINSIDPNECQQGSPSSQTLGETWDRHDADIPESMKLFLVLIDNLFWMPAGIPTNGFHLLWFNWNFLPSFDHHHHHMFRLNADEEDADVWLMETSVVWSVISSSSSSSSISASKIWTFRAAETQATFRGPETETLDHWPFGLMIWESISDICRFRSGAWLLKSHIYLSFGTKPTDPLDKIVTGICAMKLDPDSDSWNSATRQLLS